jgi:Lrp/AsnC family leucine-responsive transcriptional regulator
MQKTDIDGIDRRILQYLQVKGRVQNTELADELNLAPSTCLRRVKRLEEEGYIRGYTALLDVDKVGFPETVYVQVKLKNQFHNTVASFEKALLRLPEVLECHLVLGQSDYMIKVATASLADYRRFMLQHLTQIPEVANIESMISLKRVKSTTSLPV